MRITPEHLAVLGARMGVEVQRVVPEREDSDLIIEKRDFSMRFSQVTDVADSVEVERHRVNPRKPELLFSIVFDSYSLPTKPSAKLATFGNREQTLTVYKSGRVVFQESARKVDLRV